MIKTFAATKTDSTDTTNLVITVDILDGIDFEKAVIEAAKEYCCTPIGKCLYEHNDNHFNWGDFSCIPNEICRKHGFTKMTIGVAATFPFDQQLVSNDDVFPDRKIEDYVVNGLRENIGIIALGYDEDKDFIKDVVGRYKQNIKQCDEDYSESDARNDAIRDTLRFWKAFQENPSLRNYLRGR